jgi:glycosyltransferase involved in cell wall biosynthesis
MALGKPVVAFDLPEHRYTAQDAAVYAAPNVELDLARKLALLMDDPDQRAAMGRAGLARVRAELAWEHQAAALLSVYASLGQQEGVPAV